MKGWADAILLVILILLTFILYSALELKADNLETRTTTRQAEIISVKGAYGLLTESLGATWKQIGADAIIGKTAERFGLPLYWFKFNTSSAESMHLLPSTETGCTAAGANPTSCSPDAAFANSALAAAVRAVTLPSQFEIIVSIGRSGSIVPNVTLGTSSANLSIAADRASGSAEQNVKMSAGNTGVDANPTITFVVKTQLKTLLDAARAAVSQASAAHSSGMPAMTGDLSAGNFRTLQTTALDAKLQSIFSNARALLNDITLSADGRTSARWAFAKPSLRLDYDTGITLREGLQGSYIILANCTDDWQSREFSYNRFAGAIETAMPDVLEPYIDNPRATLASLAESNSWNPTNLFGNGESDAATSAIKQVEKLVGDFKSGITLSLPNVNAWKTNCKFIKRPLLRSPLSSEIKLVGCFGDRRCSGGGPTNALGEEFYNGIDILAQQGETVYAMDGGRVVDVERACGNNLDCPSSGPFRGAGNYVWIAHEDENGELYYSVYGHLNDIDANVLATKGITAGQKIGTVGISGNTATPMLHLRIYKRISQDSTFYYANPCLYIGCMPNTPQAVPGMTSSGVPKPTVLASPQDYADFLTQKNIGGVRLGDDFCAPSDRRFRSSNLGYGFYSTEQDFRVYAAFDGEVIGKGGDESGCGETIYVDSGDFVTVYGGINSWVNLDDKVGPWRQIGVVATSPDRLCPNPHLTVVFSEPKFYTTDAIGSTDRCGKAVCTGFAIAPARCSATGNCVTIPEIPGAPLFQLPFNAQYCAAIEWPVRRAADGWLWQHTQNTFERKPVELNFRIADSFKVLDCSQRNERLTWLNPKDALCYNGTLWTCGSRISVPGASAVSKNGCAGGDADCTGGYKCAEQEVTDVPAGAERAGTLLVLGGRMISKFCASGEETRDWICCAGTGHTLQCPQSKWLFEGGVLTCEEDAQCV